MAKELLCPICKKAVEPSNEDFPFCSDRCRLIDLGKWAAGDYKISSPSFDPEFAVELEQAKIDAARRREGKQ